MALLQVRNFPDDLYAVLRETASRERRSIAQQTVLFVKRGMDADTAHADRRRRAIERTMQREIPNSFKEVDFTTLIREDRER